MTIVIVSLILIIIKKMSEEGDNKKQWLKQLRDKEKLKKVKKEVQPRKARHNLILEAERKLRWKKKRLRNL
jgi:hypothetical protein